MPPALCFAMAPTICPLPSPRNVEASTAIKTIANSVAAANHGRLAGDVPAQIASLRRGDWVKLICGASFEDAADVRNLSLVYTLAGVDCIDCAADESVVCAVNKGIDAALLIEPLIVRPWVMVSVNDDCEDLHFRKAEFDPNDCPPDCSRPCEIICPADAILLKRTSNGVKLEQTDNPSEGKLQGGVITERCYGCGRCLSVCPYDKIRARTYVRDPATTSELLRRDDVDAIEIHTRAKGTELFNELWSSLGESVDHAKLVAVSLPDIGESTFAVMNSIYKIMQSHPSCYNLWQLDGRPMSGDIGRGATKDTIAFAVRVASTVDRPKGFYQLAGGTNSHTIACLEKAGLFRAATFTGTMAAAESMDCQQALIGGIAYGGYARKIVGRVLHEVATQYVHIEDHPDYLLEALREAVLLVGPVKCYEDAFVQKLGYSKSQ